MKYLIWWQYVLNDSRANHKRGPWNTGHYLYIHNPFAHVLNYLARCWCRANGHPTGVYFYNAGGYEPDMRCKGCGENLA